MEIVKSDGSLFTGITCLYQLANGSFLFSERVRDEGEAYVFDARKTCMIVLGPPKQNGHTPYQVIRMDGSAFQPQTVRVLKGAVVFVQDTTDATLIKTARAVIAGIVMPQGER